MTFNIVEINGELAIEVMHEGYNIIERTIYNPELAQSIKVALSSEN